MVIINRDGHIIWSEFILICGLSVLIAWILNELKLTEVLTGLGVSVGVFLFGAILPDFDHHKVQEKLHIKKLLGKYTKHRGHWHSFGALGIYGLIIFVIVYPLQLRFWYYIVFAGCFGFFTHLLLDAIKNIKSGGTPVMKLW